LVATHIIVKKISNAICPEDFCEIKSKTMLAIIKQTEVIVSMIILISISCVIMSETRQNRRKNDYFSAVIENEQNTMQRPMIEPSAKG